MAPVWCVQLRTVCTSKECLHGPCMVRTAMYTVQCVVVRNAYMTPVWYVQLCTVCTSKECLHGPCMVRTAMYSVY